MSIVLETLIRYFEREPNAVMWPNGIALRHGEIAAVLRHHALLLLDRIRELEAQVQAVDAEREQAFQVAQQNEQTARRLREQLVINPYTLAASEPVACRCGKCSGLGLVDVDLSDKPHPSAAGVTVTEAMVEAAFVRLYPGCFPEEMQWYHADDIRAAITAALTAAREVQPHE